MKKGTKNFLLVMAGFLGAAGIVGAGVATVGILRQNNIKTPWDNAINNVEYKDTYVGVRFMKDGSDPVRTGVAKDFVAGINGDKNDFDHYPVFSAMQAKKRSDGNIAVAIPEHYVKTVIANSYVEYMMAPTQIDDTWIKVEAHSIAAYKGDVSFDSKGKGTMHSRKDEYGDFNFTKVEAAEYAKRANAHINTYVEAMDLSYLQTIEFATMDMQEIFSGFTNSDNRIEDSLTFDPAIQKTGKTNILRIATEAFDEALGDKKASEVLIPGFTSIALQDSDNYASNDVLTVQSYKKVNVEIEKEAASGTSAEEGTETVNCYEITLDRTVNFDDEIGVIAERWADRKQFGGESDEADDYDGSQFIQIGCYVKNGLTDGLKGSSHELTEINGVKLPKGTRPFSYRGVENWYGSVYEWIDGVQFKTVSSATAANVGCFVQTCEDVDLMGESDAEDAKTPDYKTIAKLGGGHYAAGFGEMEEGKLFPIAVTDEEEGSFHDYVYYSTGNTLSAGSNSNAPEDQVTLRPVSRGGYWYDGSNAGSFYLYGDSDFSNWDCNFGARLGF